MSDQTAIFNTANDSLPINKYEPNEIYTFNPSLISGWNKGWRPKTFTVISAQYNGNELKKLVIKYHDENTTHTFEDNKSIIYNYSAPFPSIVMSTHPTKIRGGGKRRKSRKSRKNNKSRKTRRRRR